MLINKFKTFRVQKNLSIQQAADLIGVTSTYWKSIENESLSKEKMLMYSNVIDMCNRDVSKIGRDIPDPLDFMRIKKYGISKKELTEITGVTYRTWENLSSKLTI